MKPHEKLRARLTVGLILIQIQGKSTTHLTCRYDNFYNIVMQIKVAGNRHIKMLFSFRLLDMFLLIISIIKVLLIQF